MKLSPSLIKSFILHGIVVVFLAIQFHSMTIRVQPTGNPDAETPIVQAVAVKESEVISEMKRLAAQQQKQEQTKQQKLAELEKKAKAVEQQKKLAEQQKKAAEEKLQAKEKQIAIEKEKLAQEKVALQAKEKAIAAEKAAQQKAAAEAEQKRRQAELEKEKAEKARIAAQKAQAAKEAEEARQSALQQESEALLQQALASEAQMAASTEEIQKYYGVIVRKIQQNWRRDYGENNDLSCRIQVRLLPSGEVSDVKIIQSSGSPQFDRQAALAVVRSSPLPLPDNPRARQAFLSGFDFLFRPEG